MPKSERSLDQNWSILKTGDRVVDPDTLVFGTVELAPVGRNYVWVLWDKEIVEDGLERIMYDSPRSWKIRMLDEITQLMAAAGYDSFS